MQITTLLMNKGIQTMMKSMTLSQILVAAITLISLSSVAHAEATARASFQKTCAETMVKKKNSKKALAESTCECIVKTIAPKITEADFKLLVAAYDGTLTDAQEEAEETSVLLNFELDAAAACVAKTAEPAPKNPAN